MYYGYGRNTCPVWVNNTAFSYLTYGFNAVLTPSYICGNVLTACASSATRQTIGAYQNITLAAELPYLAGNNLITKMYQQISGMSGRPQYKILHISDLYIDVNYATGTSTDCGENLCCQSKYGTAAP